MNNITMVCIIGIQHVARVPWLENSYPKNDTSSFKGKTKLVSFNLNIRR
jgi:hypothetical protein